MTEEHSPSALDETTTELRLEALHERHPGVTPGQAPWFFEAACVCLSRHHTPPCSMRVSHSDNERDFAVPWQQPDERMLRAWHNRDETTEFGACAVALAAAEAMLGLFAVERGDVRIGADYYMAPEPQVQSLEYALRLEISGVDQGSEARLAARLREKVQQTKLGESNTPAIASVVGFLLLRVLFQTVE